MFKEMRKEKRQLEEEQALGILRRGEYGVLSTIGENGYPYGIPLNYVYLKGNIYFHCAQEGQKIENISYNEKVSFCVVEKSQILAKKFTTNFSSTIVFGRVEEVEETEKKEALLEFINRFSPQYIKEGEAYVEKMKGVTKVVKIKIEQLTGKARQ